MRRAAALAATRRGSSTYNVCVGMCVCVLLGACVCVCQGDCINACVCASQTASVSHTAAHSWLADLSQHEMRLFVALQCVACLPACPILYSHTLLHVCELAAPARTRTRCPLSQAGSCASRASGTAVVLPAPGGAWSTAELLVSRAASRSWMTSLRGSGAGTASLGPWL